jgi:uridine kinase
VDGFHNSKSIRYRLGKNSPEGFFRDSYNYPTLKEMLLDPLSKGGIAKYRTEAFNFETDASIQTQVREAIPGSILLFDGIFLHREELRSYWDFSIFLDVAFATSIPRGAQRGPEFGSPDPTAESNKRYIDGQNLYLNESQPKKYATLIVDNNELSTPRIQSDRYSEATKVHQKLMRKKTFAQKWKQACALRDVAWAMKAARIRSQNPEWSGPQVQDAVRKIFLYGST